MQTGRTNPQNCREALGCSAPKRSRLFRDQIFRLQIAPPSSRRSFTQTREKYTQRVRKRKRKSEFEYLHSATSFSRSAPLVAKVNPLRCAEFRPNNKQSGDRRFSPTKPDTFVVALPIRVRIIPQMGASLSVPGRS